jgi:hypothetical protein
MNPVSALASFCYQEDSRTRLELSESTISSEPAYIGYMASLTTRRAPATDNRRGAVDIATEHGKSATTIPLSGERFDRLASGVCEPLGVSRLLTLEVDLIGEY